MICRSTGIALRIAPFSRTSHMVTWLTPDHGLVTTVVKGSQRPKSAFLGQYDLFYLCEILFYSRERNGVHVLKEASAVDTRGGLRGNWKATACVSYFSELAARTCHPGGESAEMFDLLDRTIAFATGHKPDLALVCWFELQAMEALGFAPRLEACTACGRKRPEAGERFNFAFDGGGVICRACSASRPGILLVELESEALAALRFLQAEPDPVENGEPPTTDRHMLSILNLLGRFMEHHATGAMAAREVALELLQ